MSDFYQLAIIAFILLGVFVAWRAGQANPEGTGRLARRIGNVEKELQGKATTQAVTQVTADVANVNSKVDSLAATLEGDRRLNQLTYQSVKRIEDYLIQKGLDGR